MTAHDASRARLILFPISVAAVLAVASSAQAQDEPLPTAVVVQSTAAVPIATPKVTVGAPPVSGLAMDARLVHAFGENNGVLGGADGLPPIALGFRGERFAVLVGPYYRSLSTPYHYTTGATSDGSGNLGGLGTTVTGRSELRSYGATLLLELVLARTDDKRTAAHAIVGGTIAENKWSASVSGHDYPEVGEPSSYGLSVGVGLRHWLTPNLGLSAEIGEAYTTTPIGDERARQLTTFGALGLSLVL